MEKKNWWIGMLAVALAWGMTVVGCYENNPDDGGDDNRPWLEVSVRLGNVYPAVGETITAEWDNSSNKPAPIGTPSWKWYKTKTGVGNDSWSGMPADATYLSSGKTYTVQQSDKDFLLWAELSYSGNRGTRATRIHDTVVGTPSTATVSVSIEAEHVAPSVYYVTVKLTLSDGKWKDNRDDYDYDTVSKWFTMSGSPTPSEWYTTSSIVNPTISPSGRSLLFMYSTTSTTNLTISNLKATLDSTKLDAMREKTNVSSSLTAGTAEATVSNWTEK